MFLGNNDNTDIKKATAEWIPLGFCGFCNTGREGKNRSQVKMDKMQTSIEKEMFYISKNPGLKGGLLDYCIQSLILVGNYLLDESVTGVSNITSAA